jgi:putative Mg2+ transporter-C (MgtC) family protein
MDAFVHEVMGNMPDPREVARVSLRMIAALVIGTIIGLQREITGKAAGLRTHMLVALGTTLFVVAAAEIGMHEDAMSRVIQGLVTGIGFLGAGTILKLAEQERIRGLTTAAGIWMTAAASVAVGLGQYVAAFIGTFLAWVVLSVIWRVERRLGLNDSEGT